MTRAMSASSRQGRSVRFPEGLIVLLLLIFGVGSALIFATIEQSPLSAVFLLGFVSVGGLSLCRATQAKLNDPSLKVLGYFWLIKLALTLFLLYAGWMPQLDPSSSLWGYDPQRYYIQAQELIDNQWSPDFLNLNYVGILYFYGAIFYVFGHNPVIPALINALVTLAACLYLVKVGYEIKGQRGPRDWILAFALLLPEVLWFDVMTSRETLVGAGVLYATLPIGRYLARTAPLSLITALTTSGLAVLAIAAVRTSMLLPVFASIALMILLVKPQRGSQVIQRLILAAAAAAILLLLPRLAAYIGGYEFDTGNALDLASSATENIALSSDMQWSENSIGMLLMPNGWLQSILYLPPRMVLYLVAPLPNIWVSVSDLLAGSWGAWQHILTIASSVINVLAIPYALASFVQSIRGRQENTAPLILHISYWMTFMAVAGGNLIIHERYRVMASLLLWGCAWLGARTCTRRLIIKTSLLWYGLLAFGALFYLIYKNNLA